VVHGHRLPVSYRRMQPLRTTPVGMVHGDFAVLSIDDTGTVELQLHFVHE